MPIDEERVEQIFQKIITAIAPDQGLDGFWNILVALERAYSFQLALICPVCRRKLAKRLKAGIPHMMVMAAEMQSSAGVNPKCDLH